MVSLFGDTENSANVTAAWHPEPQFRGTYGILSSCVITLGLCIWTAVHLNLPEHEKAKEQVWRKMKWLFLALLAPEIIVWTAFEQRREAKKVHSRVSKALEFPIRTRWQKMRSVLDVVFCRNHKSCDHDHEKNNSAKVRPTRKHTWTMVHAHFAVMGGFCFDTSDTELNFLPGERTRVTITSRGICSLAELAPELLPDLSKEQILDKSKADGFGKTLACLQALWFCTQCISRLATGLTITLLELNTFAHALCALLAYALWWSKPHDVNEPVLLRGTAIHKVCAAMCMRSRIGAEHACEGYFEGDRHVGRIWEESLGFACPLDTGLPEALIGHKTTEESESRPIYCEISAEDGVTSNREQMPNPGAAPNVRLYMGQSLFGFGFRRKRKPYTRHFTSRKSNIQDVGILHIRRPFIDLTPSNFLLWRLASQGLQDHPDLFYLPPTENYRSDFHNNTKKMHRRFRTEFCIDRVSNVSALEMLDRNVTSIWLTFLVAGLGYGMLHLSAWNAPFRTEIEATFWRLSAITLTVSGFAPPLYVGALKSMIYVVDSKIYKAIAKSVRKLEHYNRVFYGLVYFSLLGFAVMVFYSIGIGSALLYLFSRVYLIVECFLKLPYLPPTALRMPIWSQYFSHIM